MTQVPSNLIPTRITQLPEPGSPSADGYLVYVYEGRTYKVRAGDLLLGTIPDGSITTAKLASGAVTNTKIASSAVTSSKITTGNVTTSLIADTAVTTAKVADGAITNVKLGSGSVTTSKIASGAVDTGQLANGAVTNLVLAANAVNTTNILNGAVINAKLGAGAVSDDKLSTLGSVRFDPAASAPSFAEGKVFYDSAAHSLAYYNDDQNVTVNVGREQLVRVYNSTLGTFLNGAMVYINGAVGGWPTIALAQANSATASQSTLGMVTADIAPGSYGYVCVSGVVNGVNTSAYASGATLYLSAAGPGGLTDTRPLQPNYVVEVATVLDSNAVTGKVLIRVDKQDWFPNIEVRDLRTTVVLPTTPQVFVAQNPVTPASGFSYDAGTGVLTFEQSGSYAITIQFNAEPSASNKNIYFYAEDSMDGVTWNITQYSGRQLLLPNSTQTQVQVNAARYYPVGTRLRFKIWGDDTIYLRTSNLPGTATGTVVKPAYRLLIA